MRHGCFNGRLAPFHKGPAVQQTGQSIDFSQFGLDLELANRVFGILDSGEKLVFLNGFGQEVVGTSSHRFGEVVSRIA